MRDTSLVPLLILLLSGVIGAAAASFMRQSPILGFLVAGMVIGEHGFNLVHNSEWTQLAAELGVAFLLFDIGLHLSLPKLWESKADLLGTAPLQLVLTGLVFGTAAFSLTGEGMFAFLVASGLALSSTAVALQVLREQGDGNTPVGQSAASILIVQDLFVIALLVALPSIASESGSVLTSVGSALAKMAGAFVGIVVIGRWILQPSFRTLARVDNSDLFTGASLFVILGVSYGAAQIGLSMSLGAFLAGVALSESRYAHLVRMEISPFRGLLLALFFLTVGMNMDAGAIAGNVGALLILVPLMVFVKIGGTYAAYRLMRYDRVFSVRVAFALAQGSEFTLVLMAWGLAEGIVSVASFQLISAAIGITMALTPLVNALGKRRTEKRVYRECTLKSRTFIDEDAAVFIIGFSGLGRILADRLQSADIRVTGFENNRERVAEERASGYDVEYGEPSRPRALSLISRGKARAVIAMSDNEEIALLVVTSVADMKTVPVFAAARNFALFERLNEIIPGRVFMKSESAVPHLFAAVLSAIGADVAHRTDADSGNQSGSTTEDLRSDALQLGQV